jgi:hypothetical protein
MASGIVDVAIDFSASPAGAVVPDDWCRLKGYPRHLA